jgi:2-oxoglutarate dehydrogenase E2 component (dihydrolipoamide succinyltransferase)
MNESREYKDQRLSRIYREGAWPEPSRQIDQAILAASRRAAREQPFVRRWAPSFAIAATVILTSTLVLKVYQEQSGAVSPTLQEKVEAPGAKQPPSAAEAKAAETKPAPAPALQPAATPQGFSSTMDAAEAERLGRLQRDLDLRRSAPPSESPTPPQNYAQPAAALKKETTNEIPRAGDALQRRPDATQALRARESSVPPPREQRPATAPVSVFAAPPPASAPSPAPAPAAPASAPAPASGPEAALGTATISGAATNVLNAATKAPERSPQAWIEDIRKLMAAGKSEEAGSEIAEFKKRYPDYALPEDLR